MIQAPSVPPPPASDLTLGMIAATVEIDQPQPDGKRIVGTGFLVSYPTPDGSPRTVLVTANHVFRDMPGETARLGYRFQDAGKTWHFSAQPVAIRSGAAPLWTRHPDRDVAVMRIEAPPEFAKAAIPLSWLADEDAFERDGVAPGDEMFVLGFPEGLAANRQGFPILRVGRVASYPLTPVREFPNFLLDFRVSAGNSGGPVFMTHGLRRASDAPPQEEPFVAGILTQQTSVGGEPLGLGVVIHAVFVREAVALLDAPPIPITPPPPVEQPSAPAVTAPSR